MTAQLAKIALDATAASPLRTLERSTGSRGEPELLEHMAELFAFEAPYLELKLVRLGVVDEREQARVLFHELKKYLVLAELHPELHIPMFSVRVDEAWHQFALFTLEYARFCSHFFGHFVHHFPAEAPRPAEVNGRRQATFEELGELCRARFGAFGDVWSDERGLGDDTRLRRAPWAGPLVVETDAERAVLKLDDGSSEVLCRVNRRAAGALRFIAEHRHFYLRELPELRGASERLALCRPLIGSKIIRIAP